MYVPVACVVFLSQSIILIISYIIGYTSNMHICKDLNPASFDHLYKSAPIINKKSKKKNKGRFVKLNYVVSWSK